MVEETNSFKPTWIETDDINGKLVGVYFQTLLGRFMIGWLKEETPPTHFACYAPLRLISDGWETFKTREEAEAFLIKTYLVTVESISEEAKTKPTLPIVPQLQWSEVRKPDEKCGYDHVFVDTPIGRITVEWKSWKEYDSYCIQCNSLDHELWGFDNAFTLEEAKQKAQARYTKLIYDMLAASTPPMR
jgi:hypothetical protein